MRLSMLLAAVTTALAALLGASVASAQSDPYPAVSHGAVSYSETVAAANSGATDLYLFAIEDVNVPSRNFDEATGSSQIWAYYFYSPSLDSVYLVATATQGNIIFVAVGTQTRNHWRATPPTPLDTTGAFVASAALGSALTADAGYQQFRLQHSDLARSVRLSSIETAAEYPPPPAFPVDRPVWTVTSANFGDSVHVCYFATGTGELACGTYFYKGSAYSVANSSESNVGFVTTNFGFFGGDVLNGETSFEAPIGSGNEYIYGAGIWVGANKRINGTLQPRVFLTYDPNSGQSWATPGDGWVDRSTYSLPLMYSSAQHDSETGERNDGEEFRWPLWVTDASSTPSYMRPGTFVPLNTDRVAGSGRVRPAFVPGNAEQFVSRYSDADVDRYLEQIPGFPLGLQFAENVYGMPGELDHTVIVTHEIVNMSSDTLFDVAIGAVTDFDIGSAGNDRTRFYSQAPEVRTALAWSTPEGQSPPFGLLVMSVLEAPMTDSEGFIDNDKRELYHTDGRVAGYQAWKIEEDPQSSAQRYSFMTSGQFDQSAGAGDYRGLLVSSRFNMLPGDTAHFAVSYLVNRDLRAINGEDATLADRVRSVMNVYYGEPFTGVRNDEVAGGSMTLSALPNPASDRLTLHIDSKIGTVASIALFNHMGERVMISDQVALRAGGNVQPIHVAGLASGSYVVVVTAGSQRVVAPVMIAR